jgi:ABC-type sulfate transport system permease subunit
VTWLSLIVLIPLATLVWRSASLGAGEFWDLATSPRALASYKLSSLYTLRPMPLDCLRKPFDSSPAASGLHEG